jgi:hypothetical protein
MVFFKPGNLSQLENILKNNTDNNNNINNTNNNNYINKENEIIEKIEEILKYYRKNIEIIKKIKLKFIDINNLFLTIQQDFDCTMMNINDFFTIVSNKIKNIEKTGLIIPQDLLTKIAKIDKFLSDSKQTHKNLIKKVLITNSLLTEKKEILIKNNKKNYFDNLLNENEKNLEEIQNNIGLCYEKYTLIQTKIQDLEEENSNENSITKKLNEPLSKLETKFDQTSSNIKSIDTSIKAMQDRVERCEVLTIDDSLNNCNKLIALTENDFKKIEKYILLTNKELESAKSNYIYF